MDYLNPMPNIFQYNPILLRINTKVYIKELQRFNIIINFFPKPLQSTGRKELDMTE